MKFHYLHTERPFEGSTSVLLTSHHIWWDSSWPLRFKLVTRSWLVLQESKCLHVNYNECITFSEGEYKLLYHSSMKFHFPPTPFHYSSLRRTLQQLLSSCSINIDSHANIFNRCIHCFQTLDLTNYSMYKCNLHLTVDTVVRFTFKCHKFNSLYQ
jgi:hypothetical protein